MLKFNVRYVLNAPGEENLIEMAAGELPKQTWTVFHFFLCLLHSFYFYYCTYTINECLLGGFSLYISL